MAKYHSPEPCRQCELDESGPARVRPPSSYNRPTPIVRGGSMLRIIAGERRGHKFDGPSDPRRTRATTDLVRESIFNILGEWVLDRPVIDLFAGSGALGLEALSRGAASAVFVEKRRDNAALIARNLATLRFEGRGEVVVGNAYEWASKHEFAVDQPVVVFLDPPYSDYETRPKRVFDLLVDLIDRLPAGSMLMAETGRVIDGTVIPDLESWDVRRYGDTRIAFREIGPPPADPS